MNDEIDGAPDAVETGGLVPPPTSRRGFFGQAAVAAAGIGLGALAGESPVQAHGNALAHQVAPGKEAGTVPVTLKINGKTETLRIEPRVTLLDALRERLHLTGTKKGCNHGQCGACTVLVDGRRVNSCLTLALTVEGSQVTTIEGLAQGDNLHPMQEAFLEHDGYQCGYCTPGQICSAVALLSEVQKGIPSAVTPDVRQKVDLTTLSDLEIRERMSGNLCRCSAYPNIVASVRDVAKSGKGGAV